MAIATSTRQIVRLLIVTTVAVLLTGCQATLPRDGAAVPTSSNAELIQYIANEPLITAEPAYRATYILATGAPFTGSYAELATELQSRDIIDAWNYPPNQLLRRADVGYMVCRAADIRTGVNWNLLGLGRYAWRELIYHEIATGGGEWGLMSGGEFVGIIARAEDYARQNDQLPDQVDLGRQPM